MAPASEAKPAGFSREDIVFLFYVHLMLGARKRVLGAYPMGAAKDILVQRNGCATPNEKAARGAASRDIRCLANCFQKI